MSTISGHPWRIRDYFKEVPDESLEYFKLFQVELLKFNQRLNLISVNSESNADIVHFYDCIKASQYLTGQLEDVETVDDFGSGNGFPGLIFSILNPKKKMT